MHSPKLSGTNGSDSEVTISAGRIWYGHSLQTPTAQAAARGENSRPDFRGPGKYGIYRLNPGSSGE
jgi:hypothetical protein